MKLEVLDLYDDNFNKLEKTINETRCNRIGTRFGIHLLSKRLQRQ